jgi:hypothetical protein
MNTLRLFRNFVFLFSLLGLGSFAWGERYETLFIYSEDTAEMDNSAARACLNSPFSRAMAPFCGPMMAREGMVRNQPVRSAHLLSMAGTTWLLAVWAL